MQSPGQHVQRRAWLHAGRQLAPFDRATNDGVGEREPRYPERSNIGSWAGFGPRASGRVATAGSEIRSPCDPPMADIIRSLACGYIHNYSGIAIVVCVSDMVTAAQAAQRLGVNPSRVRALIAAGALAATRAGRQWLVDVDSLDRQFELTVAGATGRPFAPRIAWAAAALCDRQRDGLAPNERTRLRRRLAGLDIEGSKTCAQVQRWLARRALSVCRYRIGERDITELLGADGVLATGISAVEAYDLGLGTGGFADAYVDERVHRKLVKDSVLIDSARGNLTLRTTDSRLCDAAFESKVAPRLIAGVDLAEDTDARTRAAGCALVSHALRTVHAPRRG